MKPANKYRRNHADKYYVYLPLCYRTPIIEVNWIWIVNRKRKKAPYNEGIQVRKIWPRLSKKIFEQAQTTERANDQ